MNMEVQWLGCRALGLLHQILPAAVQTPPEALEGVLAAMKRHPSWYKVTSAACAALRGFLEPRQGRDSAAASAVTGQMVTVLRRQGMGATLQRMFSDWSDSSDKELLEDSFYALGLVEGLPAILQVLAAGEHLANVALRSAALQAMFELIRTFPDLLTTPQLAQNIYAVANTIVARTDEADKAAAAGKDAGDNTFSYKQGGELHGFASVEGAEIARRAELLIGMLQGAIAAPAAG